MTETLAQARCRRYRRRILDISQQVSALHVAPAFSCVEIVDAIYNELMKPDDIFIMSKGHAAILQYVILEEKGLLSKADLDAYCKLGGRLGAHPDYAPDLGIHASTGSLGHGLGIAVGQAYAEKLKGSGVRVYCLLSDGECQEGSTWEAVMKALELELSNLIVFVDANKFGGLEPLVYPWEEMFNAFGWGVVSVDGHTTNDIVHVGTRSVHHEGPTVAICNTIKGHPISFMKNNPIWHYRSPNKVEYEEAVNQIELTPERVGVYDNPHYPYDDPGHIREMKEA